jgi:hypothetical protein
MIDLDISKEFAGCVALGDRAGYVSGEVLVADGGQWLGKSAYTDSTPRG